jgi:hypothetical protein
MQDATATYEDFEARDDLPTALSHFVQENDEFELISEFFKEEVNVREHTLWREDIKLFIIELSNHPPSKTEFQNTYRQKLEELYDDLRDQIYLSALLLPLCIRDDLLGEVLDNFNSEYQKSVAYEDNIPCGLYEDSDPDVDEPLSDSKALGTTKLQPSEIPDSDTTETQASRTRDTPLLAASVQSVTQEHFRADDVDSPELGVRRWRKFGRRWNHLTISRDKTSASDFAKDTLFILRSSRRDCENLGENSSNNEPANKAASLPPEQLQQLLQQQKIAQNQYQQVQQNHLRLSNQALRLNRLRRETELEADLNPSARVQDNMLDSRVPVLESKGATLLQSPSFKDISDCEMDTKARHSPAQFAGQVPSVEQYGSYDQLLERITSLEAENQSLKETRESSARGQILNFILANSGSPSMAYLDEPTWSIGPKGEIILTAHFPVTDINGFLRQKHDIAFVVSRYYSPKNQEIEIQSASRAKQPLPRPKPSNETLTFHSKEMIDAVEDFFARRPDFAQNFPQFNIRGHIPAPYLFWYHYRGPDAMQGLSATNEALLHLVTTWIEDNYGNKYDLVDRQLDRGVISQDTVPFLFKPGDVIVWETKREVHAAFARSWPIQTSPLTLNQQKKERDWSKDTLDTDKLAMKWKVESWSYQYDGQFLRKKQSVEITCSATSTNEEVAISKLNVYPLKYAPANFRSILETRGRTFWRCRYRNVVSYDDEKGTYGVSETAVNHSSYLGVMLTSSN